ncbi:MAG: sulfate transporter CysZ [Proteobacteria bacterium]|nr:sulfate transporter CysZ [Pseudomonadota bacterium]
MISDIMKGAMCLGRGFRIMRQPGVRIYAVMPLLINTVLFASLIWFGYERFSPLVDYMMSGIPAIFNFLRWIIWIIISTFTAIFIFFTFTPIANIVAAPFNALLSEKIEIRLTGKTIGANSSFMKMARDSFLSQIRKLVYIIFWSAVLLLISLIPLVNFAAPFLWVIFGSWLLSLEYLDYPMGNHELNFTRQRQILAARKGLSLGFGSSVMVLTSIPLLNFIVMPVAVAGATVLWVEQLEGEM